MKRRKVWMGGITVEGKQSEDRRLFDAFSWRAFPLSLAAITLDVGQHANAVAIGTIEGAARLDSGIWLAAGYVDDTEEANAYADKIESKSQRYLSIDGIALEDRVQEAIDPATGKLVEQEAIYEAYAKADEAYMAGDEKKYAEIMAWLDSLYYRTRYPLTQVTRACLLTSPCFEEAAIEIIGYEDSVNPLEALAAKADGAKLAASAAPVDGPEVPAVLEPVEHEIKPVLALASRLVAAGAPSYHHDGPIRMPAEAYRLPDLTEPTPFGFMEGGVFMGGHIATADVCHRSWGNECVFMPESDDLSNLLTGRTPLDDGTDVWTGIITYGGPHAPDEVGDLAEEIQRRMEDVGTQLGTFVARRDKFGLQVAGAVHMDVPRTDLNRVLAAAPSGDWRDYLFFDQRWQRGKLSLFGIHIVNCPGFPVPHRQVASGGMRLIASASGIVEGSGCGCGGTSETGCGCGGHGPSATTRTDRLVRLAQLDRVHALQTAP